ncbi:unnamed protein product [Effrenium voratum]|uniref:EF-hand domain-containing protein n=1 Tax=Effrenium voratum TaxID=2562239 RepID=A0AA36IET4_9DINO|nr:unnamed protein product [Effrenium voratum]
MLPDRIDGKQAEELFARLDGPGRGYLGAGKVLRILCSDTFTQRPGVARAVAAASVRASGGRLCKEAFLEAVRAGQSSAATEESVPTLRVKLSDLFEPPVPTARCRRATASSSKRVAASPFAGPTSGVALEEWASRRFASSLRTHKASPKTMSGRKREGDGAPGVGCCGKSCAARF